MSMFNIVKPILWLAWSAHVLFLVTCLFLFYYLNVAF